MHKGFFHCPTLSQPYLLSDYLIIGLPMALGIYALDSLPCTLTDNDKSKKILRTSPKHIQMYVCMYVQVEDTLLRMPQ